MLPAPHGPTPAAIFATTAHHVIAADVSERWVARRLPRADPAPLSAETCIYTNTADDSFVCELHERIVVGSACSGHGFKFAPACGQRLAALAASIL